MRRTTIMALGALALAAVPAVWPGAESWWLWPARLFVISAGIGVLAVLSGLGGGVLFVALVGGLGPFHLDFVRGIGLLTALSGALSAAPGLLLANLASLRLAMPLALFSSIGAMAGAVVGLRAPLAWLQTALGLFIILLSGLMFFLKNRQFAPPRPGRLETLLGLGGWYLEPGQAEPAAWRVGRLPLALGLFLFIGFVAGLFGLGAGWANVPALNLVMGAPLKISVATSGLLIGLSGAPATMIYLKQGAIVPLIAAPSVLGMMAGAKIGAGLLGAVKTEKVRWATMALLMLSGLKSLQAGLGL